LSDEERGVLVIVAAFPAFDSLTDRLPSPLSLSLSFSPRAAPPTEPLPDWVALAAKRSERDEEDEDDDEDEDPPKKGATSGEEGKDEEEDKAMSATEERGTDDELLTVLHTVLMDTHVTEGELVCGGCQRRYAIQQGIPNLRLNEDEV
jgi:uncharacterized protein YbaR (Trm112 family)